MEPPRSAEETGGGTQEVGGPCSTSRKRTMTEVMVRFRHLSSHPPLLTSLACSNDPRRRNDTNPESEYPTKWRNPTTTKTSQPPVTTTTTLPQRQPYYHNENPTTTATIRLPQQRTPTTRPPRQHNTGQHDHQTTRPPANERTPRPLIEPHNDQTRRLIATKRMGRKTRRRARKKDGDGEEGKDEGRGWGGGRRARMSAAKDPLKSKYYTFNVFS